MFTIVLVAGQALVIDRTGLALSIGQVKIIDALGADRISSCYAVIDSGDEGGAAAVGEVLGVAEANLKDTIAEGAGGEVVGGW